jgi:8-oxo-dGTP diphosphatase
MKPKNFHIGIKAVIVKNGKALILNSARFKGFDLPGGRIDDNEDITKGLKRELKEELGLINFKVEKLLHVFERTDYGKKEASLMLIFFKVSARLSKLKLSEEHSDYKWISKKELKEMISKKEIRSEGIKEALLRALD